MKTPLLLISLLLLTPLAARVSSSDLDEIRRLAAEGKYEEALKKHLWFHEESKSSPGMSVVRLSAFSHWVDLGKAYPPALTALKELRDSYEARLLDGVGGRGEYGDFFAINLILKDEDRSLRLFLDLDEKQPAIAAECFEVALNLIAARGKHDLFAKYGGDPMERYERIHHLHETALRLAQRNPQLDTDSYRTKIDTLFNDRTIQLIEILVKLNRRDEARDIHKRALAYFRNPRLDKVVIDP